MKEIAVIDVDDCEDYHELLVALPKGLLDPAKSLGNVIADLQQLGTRTSSSWAQASPSLRVDFSTRPLAF